MLKANLDSQQAREVAGVFTRHELTLELLEGLSPPAWEALRQEACLTIGCIERIRRSLPTSAGVATANEERKYQSVPLESYSTLRFWFRCVRATWGWELVAPFCQTGEFLKCVVMTTPNESLKEQLLGYSTLYVTMLSLLLGGLLSIAGTLSLSGELFDSVYLVVLGLSNVVCLLAILSHVSLYSLTMSIPSANLCIFVQANQVLVVATLAMTTVSIYLFVTCVAFMVYDLSREIPHNVFIMFISCSPTIPFIPMFWRFNFAARTIAHSGGLAPTPLSQVLGDTSRPLHALAHEALKHPNLEHLYSAESESKKPVTKRRRIPGGSQVLVTAHAMESTSA